jgi:hypothetical protein
VVTQRCYVQARTKMKGNSIFERSLKVPFKMPKYIIFEVYYKHGEYNISTADSFEEFQKYTKDLASCYPDDVYPSLEKISKMSEQEIIRMLLRKGEHIIEQQIGHGCVAIVKDGNLFQLRDV